MKVYAVVAVDYDDREDIQGIWTTRKEADTFIRNLIAKCKDENYNEDTDEYELPYDLDGSQPYDRMYLYEIEGDNFTIRLEISRDLTKSHRKCKFTTRRP